MVLAEPVPGLLIIARSKAPEFPSKGTRINLLVRRMIVTKIATYLLSDSLKIQQALSAFSVGWRQVHAVKTLGPFSCTTVRDVYLTLSLASQGRFYVYIKRCYHKAALVSLGNRGSYRENMAFVEVFKLKNILL